MSSDRFDNTLNFQTGPTGFRSPAETIRAAKAEAEEEILRALRTLQQRTGLLAVSVNVRFCEEEIREFVYSSERRMSIAGVGIDFEHI